MEVFGGLARLVVAVLLPYVAEDVAAGPDVVSRGRLWQLMAQVAKSTSAVASPIPSQNSSIIVDVRGDAATTLSVLPLRPPGEDSSAQA